MNYFEDLEDFSFKVGEKVVVVDSKERHYVFKLRTNASFHTNNGTVSHNDIIGKVEGETVLSSKLSPLVVFRPTLSDIIFKMPRGAQVIYPKDIGPILIELDLFHGANVLESGVGSGALSIALLRSGAKVIGYEIREDFREIAMKNVLESFGCNLLSESNTLLNDLQSQSEPTFSDAYTGNLSSRDVYRNDQSSNTNLASNYMVKIADIYNGIDENSLDRIVLDLPEPWKVVMHAQQSLKPGGILVCYLPTINQTSTLVEEIRQSSFKLMRVFEVIERDWKVNGKVVRPEQRIVGHTGFITSARLTNQPQ